MLRAIVKGAMLGLFGRMPGGARLYREITRDRMGTQGTHVDKLKRVLPSYARVWRDRCGVEFEGKRIWIHEAGWTPFWPMANYLLSGSAGVVTNSEGHILDRYLARAVNGVLAADLSSFSIPDERRRRIEALRWVDHAADAISSLDGRILFTPDTAHVPLDDASVDLCHTGGALEHYHPDALKAFIGECFRVLKPGGIASHVLDHRDHLFHADKKLPFLGHLSLSDPIYNALFDHPLSYHNRLLPAQVAALLEQAGFERVVVRRLSLPDNRYWEQEGERMEGRQGIERSRLSRRFRIATDADLCTAAVHFLYRKPN